MADVASEAPRERSLDMERTRDVDRNRYRDRSRERRRRSRSRDRRRSRSRSRDRRRSKSRERRRSRSRSKSPGGIDGFDPDRKRRRPTWFDITPVGGAPPPISSLPGAVQVAPGAAPSGPVGGASFAGGAAATQATRHARRIYVGGLPPGSREENISSFFSNALAAVGGTTAGPGACVVNVYINQEKKFAFVELRTVEEASNAMALDGIMFEGVTVRIRRPADYNPAAAAPLGPSLPNPNLNLAAIGMDRSRDQAQAPQPQPVHGGQPMAIPPQMTQPVDQQADRVFVGGLPYYLTEEQCRELLSSFGAIKTFDLIRDRQTGDSKGYGFVVYEDQSVTEVAIAGLHGMRMGDRSLTVRRAEGQLRNAQPVVPAMAMPEGGIQPAMFTAAAPRVVKLTDAVTPEELANDDEYNDIMEDMKEEFTKFGAVQAVHIPRPAAEGAAPPPGLGKVLVEFVAPASAMAARNAVHGRKFGGRMVQAALVTDEDFKAGRWN